MKNACYRAPIFENIFIFWLNKIALFSVNVSTLLYFPSTPSPWCGSGWSGLRDSALWPDPRCSTWWLMTWSRQTGLCTSGKRRLTRHWPGSRGSGPSCPAGGGHTRSRRRPSLYPAMWTRLWPGYEQLCILLQKVAHLAFRVIQEILVCLKDQNMALWPKGIGIESMRHFLIIYSISDFILRRSVLHQLRHCQLQPGVLWGGLVMTTGDVTRASRVSHKREIVFQMSKGANEYKCFWPILRK